MVRACGREGKRIVRRGLTSIQRGETDRARVNAVNGPGDRGRRHCQRRAVPYFPGRLIEQQCGVAAHPVHVRRILGRLVWINNIVGAA